MTFDEAIDIVLQWEGGYVNHPDDPGGATKYGITKRDYPDIDIALLSRTHAERIYKRDYWDRGRCEAVPVHLRLTYFDMCVHMGHRRAVTIMQSAVNGERTTGAIKEDGILGRITLEAIQTLGADRLRMGRLKFYGDLLSWRPDTYKAFWKGWSRRATEV